jgi:hypothetical protein
MSKKNVKHLWAVTLKIKNPLMVKYKHLSNVHLKPNLYENETVLMYLPCVNGEEAFEYCKNLGIEAWSLGRAD